MTDATKSKYEIYHYKDKGEWVPFALSPEHGKDWGLFCAILLLGRLDNPHPGYEDYRTFINKVILNN